MKTLKGKVTCSVPDSQINPNAIISVEIRDVSRACAPSKLMASTQLTNQTKFPLEFSIEYDETPILELPSHCFSVSAYIRTGEQLDYCTDTRFSVLNENSQPKEYAELRVVPANPL